MMATEQEQVYNRAVMWALTVFGMTNGIWELVEESSTALSPRIGSNILSAIEQKSGRTFDQKEPLALLDTLSKAFVDELGFASDYELIANGNVVNITLRHAIGTPELAQLKAQGIEKLFSHPFLCVCLAGLARAGCKATGDVEVDPSTNTQIVSIKLR
jgi:hypothetical protein